MHRTAIAAIFLAAAVTASAPVRAAETCSTVANTVVKQAVEDVLNKVIKDHPDLTKLTQKELVKKAGTILLQAPKPDIQAYGYMMLLWYGDQGDRDQVAQTAAKLETEAQRAHFYFVMGLYQIRAEKPDVAKQGRDYIRQMRDSGHVTFVNDAMWTSLIDECQLSQ
jgi:hypothetical protein